MWVPSPRGRLPRGHLILLVIRSTGARDSPGGVFPIEFPFHDVIGDVLPDSTELGFVPDNAFKIVPLPQPLIEALPAQSPHTPNIFPGGHRFERTNHVPQRRGTPCGRPRRCPRGWRWLADENDAVYMVGHHHEFVHIDEWKPVGHPVPNPADHLPCVVQAHLPVYHAAEQSQPALRRDGNEVRASTGVVIPIEPDRPAIMNVRIVDRVVIHP